MKTATHVVQQTLKKMGVELRKTSALVTMDAQLAKALETNKIDLVVDIGANTGQFAAELRTRGYTGQILSIEPLQSAHAILLKNSQSDPKWHVYNRSAVGAKPGETSINVAANSSSSSILPMLSRHLEVAPFAAYVSTETVPVVTIDQIFETIDIQYTSAFLKIDTQGFEAHVLDGAETTSKFLRGILVELSFVPLYEGQALFQEIYDRILGLGMEMWGLQSVLINTATGQTLQADGLFIKKSPQN